VVQASLLLQRILGKSRHIAGQRGGVLLLKSVIGFLRFSDNLKDIPTELAHLIE
jgi:hypothetical protein